MNLRVQVTKWALENGDIALAKEQAKEALRIEKDNPMKYPGSTAGRMLSGYVALWAKNWKEAEDYFSKLLYEAPNDFGIKNNLALALVEQDDPKKKNLALDYAKGNYDLNKDNVEAVSTLSWVCYRLEKYSDAALALDAVVKATRGAVPNPDTKTYLAYVVFHNGAKYDAKRILESIVNSNRSFAMKPEAMKLYEQVKDEKAPEPKTTPTTASKN